MQIRKSSVHVWQGIEKDVKLFGLLFQFFIKRNKLKWFTKIYLKSIRSKAFKKFSF